MRDNGKPPMSVMHQKKLISQSNDPFSAARERGNSYTLSEWCKPNNLTLADAATYSSCSIQGIKNNVEEKKLYALKLWGRGCRYPRWQFDVENARLELVLQALHKVNMTSCWLIHNFFMHPHRSFDGLTPSQIISDKSKPIESILSVIEQVFGKDDYSGS